MLCDRIGFRSSIVVVVLAVIILITTVVYWSMANDGVRDQWDPESIERTKAVSHELIVAINRYHQENAAYPDDLDALVPVYIAELPTPLVGSQEWSYKLDGDSFDLYVESSDTDPPPALFMRFFGPRGYDDRSMEYSESAEEWFVSDW